MTTVSRDEIEKVLREFEASRPGTSGEKMERERYLANIIGRVQALVEWLPHQRGAPLLELGAEPFFVSAALARFFDLPPASLSLVDGAGIFHPEVRHDEVRLNGAPYPHWRLNAELTPLPFPDETFETVVCIDVIEHLLFDPLRIVSEANRVLRPGGVFLLSTSPAVYSWHVTLRHLLNLPIEMGYDITGGDPYARHARLFSVREVREMLSMNGFEVTRAFACTHGYTRDPLLSLKSRAMKSTTHLLERLSGILAPVLPPLREKAGQHIWVFGRRARRIEKVSYPQGLHMQAEFGEAGPG